MTHHYVTSKWWMAIAVLVVYLAGVAAVWYFALESNDAKFQAALVGAGATLTVAATSLTGGVVSAAWTSHLQQKREASLVRLTELQKLIAAVTAFDFNRAASHRLWKAKQVQGLGETARVELSGLLNEQLDLQGAAKLEATVALRNAEGVVPPDSLALQALHTLGEALNSAPSSPSADVEPLLAEEILSEARRSLSGG